MVRPKNPVVLVLLTLKFQNGLKWGVNNVVIARRASLPNCVFIFFRFPILIIDDEVQSALAQAYPDTVDAKFNTHW